MARSILIVDDDPHIREVLRFAFEKAGLATTQAGDGIAALEVVERTAPDLIVLDINMPRMNGLDVCRTLRTRCATPILFLSSRDDEVDRIVGIELGGDDYVVKPFSPREVVARAAAILRRLGEAPKSGPVENPATPMRHGALTLHPDAWTVYFREAEVILTTTEFGLLKALMSAPTRVFNRESLIDRVRGPGFAVTDRTIDSHIRNLRRKFQDVGCDSVVETRAGVGYRLSRCEPTPS